MESPRRSSIHRLRLPIAVAAAALFTVATAVGAMADCGDLAAATLNGAWQLRITVEPPTGTVPAGLPKAGTTAGQTVGLSTVCSATGQCTATLAPAGGGILPLFDNSVDFVWYPSTGLTHAGSSYTGTTPRSGYGGPGIPPCPPPADLEHDVLTLTVLQAAQDATGAWRATVVSGTEVSPEGWVCAGGTGESTGAEHLSLLAVPVGAGFPPSTGLACAAPAVTRTVATTASNPEVSSFSSDLATPSEAFGSPLHTLVGAAITLGVILFITFPSQLFNRTFEENYDEIREITLRRLGWLRRFRRDAERDAGGLLRIGAFAAVVLGGAALGSLNDRGFGFNLRSAATYIAVVLSILIGIGVGAMVGAAYRRFRRHPLDPRFHALPAGLLVAATCVLISRLSSFEPGYLYGVIASLAFQGTLPKNEQGHTAALGAVASLAVALAAWLIWVPVGHAASAPGASFAVVLAADLLGSLFVGGLVGNVIGLMPLRFLSGGTLMAWNRAAWAATFGIAVFLLVEVELRPQSASAHPGGAPIVTAVLLFVLFGGGSAGMRWYFSRREQRRRDAERAEREEVPTEGGPEPAPAGLAPAATRAPAAALGAVADVPGLAAPPVPPEPAGPPHPRQARSRPAVPRHPAPSPPPGGPLASADPTPAPAADA